MYIICGVGYFVYGILFVRGSILCSVYMLDLLVINVVILLVLYFREKKMKKLN